MEIPGVGGWKAFPGIEFPRGWGSNAKVPSVGGGRRYGYFLELHNTVKIQK